MATGGRIKVGRRTLQVSNLDKVLYPAVGFRKADVINYYIKIAPVLLPHLRDRPLTLKRYPNGVREGFFYEKQCPGHRPDWVRTAVISSRRKKKPIRFCLVNGIEELVWVANLADLELHPSLAKATAIERPTVVAFDLDPGEGTGVVACAEVALWLREILSRVGLDSYPKTSGSKGLQVYVPLNSPVTYDETKPFARGLARLLEREHPHRVVSKMTKALRRNKVFIDWSQNDEHKTTVAVYSLRAKERPTVSTPLRWEEVEEALDEGDAESLVFESDEVLARVAEQGDLFEPVLKQRQKLPLD